MARISAPKPYQLKSRVFPSFVPRDPISTPFDPIRFLCSTSQPDSPVAADSVTIDGGALERRGRPRVRKQWMPQWRYEQKIGAPNAQKGKRYPAETVEESICRIMRELPWTVRTQCIIRRIVPNFDYEIVWNVLHQCRSPKHCLQFFRWVEKTGFRHDQANHLKIIQILGRANMLNYARCIVFDMPKKGVDWHEKFFASLIDSYGRAGIIPECKKFFWMMKELGVKRTVYTYNFFFKVILRHGAYYRAKRYFNYMLSEGIQPTRHTYNVMIWGFLLSKKFKTANWFFEDMKSRKIKPCVVTYNTIIFGYCRDNNIEEAEKYFLEMKEKKMVPTVISYTTMIKGYLSMGRIDDGFRVLQEMRSAGIEPNKTTYATLLPGLCDAGRLAEAQNIMKELLTRSIAPTDTSVLTKMLSCQCRAGELDAAVDVLRVMQKLNFPMAAGHYGMLLEKFCKSGVYDQAINLLDELIEKEIILNPQTSLEMEASAYNLMIEYLCSHGHAKKAETFFRQLMKTGVLDPVAFNNIICGHSKEGNPDSAFDALKIMVKRGVPTEPDAYRLLVECYLNKGEPADAKIALDSMVESGHRPDSSLYRSVMDKLFEDGRVQTASRVLKLMVEKGVKENMDLVAKILEALFMRGHAEEALGRVLFLVTSGCEVDFDSLFSLLCKEGNSGVALQLVAFGLDRGCNIDASSYDKVLDTLLADGKTIDAYKLLCKVLEKGGSTNWGSCEYLINCLNDEGFTRQSDILTRMIKGSKKETPRKKLKKRTGTVV